MPFGQQFAPVQADGDFANFGGAPAVTASAPSSRPEPQTPTRPSAAPQAQSGGLLKIALGSAVSAVLIFGGYFLYTSSQTKPKPVVAATKKKKKSKPKTKSLEEIREAEDAERRAKLAAEPPLPSMIKPVKAKPRPAPVAPLLPPGPPQTVENMPPEVRAAVGAAIDKKMVPELIGFLGHAHGGARLLVAQQLATFEPDPTTAPALVKMLQDPYPDNRKAAAKALVRQGVGVPGVIPALGTAAHQDRDWQVKVAAAATLGEIATAKPELRAEVATALVPALSSSQGEDLPALMAAAGTLGAAGQPAIPTLIAWLTHPQLAEDAVSALAQLGHFEPFTAILAGKTSLHIQQKRRMAEGLGRMRPMTQPGLAIIKTLAGDEDATVRLAAIDALDHAEPKLLEATPLLEKALADAAPPVQELAKKAIVPYQEADPVFKMQKLLTQFKAEDKLPWSSSEISKTILSTKEEGFKAIVTLIANPQKPPEMRELASQVLALSWGDGWYDAKLTEDLKKVFSTPDQSLTIRTGCAVTLLKLGVVDPMLGATLLDAIRDKSVDYGVREAAAYIVPAGQENHLSTLIAAAMECEGAEPEGLSELARRKRTEFHRGVLDTMKSLKPEERSGALPHLVAGLRQSSGIIKWMACDTLQRYEEVPPEAIELLRAALKDEQKEVREKVLETIGKLHKVAAAAIPDVREGLKSEDRHWRMLSAKALEEFGPAAADAIPDLLAILSDTNRVTDYVARAAARIAPESDMVAAALNQALNVPELREEVVKALQEVGVKAAVAVPELQKILTGVEEKLRIPALRVLGVVGEAAKPAIPDIVRLLADKDEATREAAANTLGNLKEHAVDAVPDLIKTLVDASQNVQRESLRALGEIGPAAKAAIPDVEKYLTTAATDQLKQLAETVLTKLKAEPAASDPAKS